MKPKDIFGLAVRLLGLLFLYFGLREVMPLLDLELIRHPDTDDIANGLMPVVFNLAVAWWLLGGWLARRAYPESQEFETRSPERMHSRQEPVSPQPRHVPLPQLSGMEQAEQKLAALVEKRDERRPA